MSPIEIARSAGQSDKIAALIVAYGAVQAAREVTWSSLSRMYGTDWYGPSGRLDKDAFEETTIALEDLFVDHIRTDLQFSKMKRSAAAAAAKISAWVSRTKTRAIKPYLVASKLLAEMFEGKKGATAEAVVRSASRAFTVQFGDDDSSPKYQAAAASAEERIRRSMLEYAESYSDEAPSGRIPGMASSGEISTTDGAIAAIGVAVGAALYRHFSK